MHVHAVQVVLHDRTTADRCAALMASMADKFDGLVHFEVRQNEVVGAYSADLSLTTTWVDLAAYEVYASHPDHLEVRQQVLDLMSNATTLDYTIDDIAP